MAHSLIHIANPRPFCPPSQSSPSAPATLSASDNTVAPISSAATSQSGEERNGDVVDQFPDNLSEASTDSMDTIITINTDDDIIHPNLALPIPNLQDEEFNREELCFNLYIADLYERSKALVDELNVIIAVCDEEKDHRNATMRRMFERFNAREAALRRVGSTTPAEVRAVHNTTIFDIYDVGTIMWEAYWKTAMKSKAEVVGFYERCLREGPEFVLGDDIEEAAEASTRRMRPLPETPLAVFLRDSADPAVIQRAKDYCAQHDIFLDLSDPVRDLKNVHDYVSDPRPIGPQMQTVEPPPIVVEKIDIPEHILTDHLRRCLEHLPGAMLPSNLSSLVIQSPRAGDPALIFSSPNLEANEPIRARAEPVPLPYILNVQASLDHNLLRERTIIVDELARKLDPVTRRLREAIILPPPEILWPAGPSEHPIVLRSYASGIHPALIPVDLGRAGIIEPGAHEGEVLALVAQYDIALSSTGGSYREEEVAGLRLGELRKALERIAGMIEEGEEGTPFKIMVPRVKLSNAEFIARVHEECYRRIPHSRGIATVVVDEDGEKLFEVKAMNGIWNSVFADTDGGIKFYSMLFIEEEEGGKEEGPGMWGGGQEIDLPNLAGIPAHQESEEEEEIVYNPDDYEGEGDFMDVD